VTKIKTATGTLAIAVIGVAVMPLLAIVWLFNGRYGYREVIAVVKMALGR
jgi:hypothetical protein